MTKTPRTRCPFIQACAFPEKVHTPVRIARFVLQDMIDRNPMFKGLVSVLLANKHIGPFVLIDLRLYLNTVRESKARSHRTTRSRTRNL